MCIHGSYVHLENLEYYNLTFQVWKNVGFTYKKKCCQNMEFSVKMVKIWHLNKKKLKKTFMEL